MYGDVSWCRRWLFSFIPKNNGENTKVHLYFQRSVVYHFLTAFVSCIVVVVIGAIFISGLVYCCPSIQSILLSLYLFRRVRMSFSSFFIFAFSSSPIYRRRLQIHFGSCELKWIRITQLQNIIVVMLMIINSHKWEWITIRWTRRARTHAYWTNSECRAICKQTPLHWIGVYCNIHKTWND